jgi:hypothetical protein
MTSILELVGDEALVADSYERVKAELAAVPADEFAPLKLDVQTVARSILGAIPEMRAMRDSIVKQLPAFNVAAFDKLEDYVQALKFAQSGFQIATQPTDDLPVLAEEGGKLFDRLLADAKALALYGLFDSKQLDQLKGGNGINNLAEDLELLSHAMMDNWPKIQGKALTPLEDVQVASRIGLRLTRIAGLREQGPARLAAATELRLRAFTLVFRTYEDARSAIAYLRRREGDAESIAPSLYAGRGRRKQSDPAPDVTQVPAGTVSGTVPAPVTAPAAGAQTGVAAAGTQVAGNAPKGGVVSKDPFLA